MSAGDLAVVLAAVLCTIGFAALVVVLLRVLDAMRELRSEVEARRVESEQLIADLAVAAEELRAAADQARADLDRFDRVLGSAEAVSAVAARSGGIARVALSAPAIKVAGLATGTARTVTRLRTRRTRLELVDPGRRR